MNIEILLIVILAAWRLASLLADEHGPYLVLERIRFLLGVHYITRDGIVVKTHATFRELSEPDRAGCVRVAETEIANLITCAWCSSIWIAAILVLFILWLGQPVVWVLLPFSVSTGVIIVNRIING
jgi:hypothetical protein